MKNIGMPKYGIITNGIFGTRIVSGIVTGVRFTEDKPIYELSFGKDKWWTSEITDNIEDIFKVLNLVSLNRVKETHKKVIRTISEKTHIPGFILSFAEKVAMAAGLFVGVHMLGTTGKAVYEAGLGGLFTLEGPLATLKSTKDTLKLISATDESAASFKDLKDSAELASGEKLTGREKEKIMDHIGNAVLGLTLGTFGLYLLGVAPRSVIWPAAIAALSIRSGKEVAKTLVSKKDHDDFIKESKEFSEMTVTEKLDYIQKNRN